MKYKNPDIINTEIDYNPISELDTIRVINYYPNSPVIQEILVFKLLRIE